MTIKNQNKFKSNLTLLQGGSLEEYNEFFRKLFLERGISASLEFNLERLQQFINQEKSFGKGLIAYLKEFEKQLDEITDDKDLKLYIFQILSELGSLVFPNTSACYSIIPSDLKKIKWEEKLQDFNNKIENKNPDIQNIKSLLNIFLSKKYSETLCCLVALCLCDVLVRSINKMNSLLVDENGEFVGQDEAMRPRLKASTWIDQLSFKILVHLRGLRPAKLSKDQIKILEWYSVVVARKITEILLQEGLIVSYKTIQSTPLKDAKIKTAVYFAWTGSNLLTFPKTLALPMVCPPNDWVIDSFGGANSGGYFLSSLTDISYQGYLDSKSSRVHNHSLHLKEVSHLNNLQKVKFTINERMVAFYNKYQKELTDNETLLLTEKWIKPNEDLTIKISNKWAKIFDSPTIVSNAISKEFMSKKNETLRNQEIIKVAQLYCNKDLYWPVVQDFRGRVYRIGNLNIQLNEFVRSMIAFQSDKPFVNRKKNKYTIAQFNLLLKEVLVKKELIEKWDDVFGNRLINNETFEALLLEDLLVKKLSLIQVGQLLLIRQGAYDKVGVYYDASSSAYQIMGSITGDKELCQLTNVLKSKTNQKKQKKEDLYEFFLNELNELNSDFKDAVFTEKVTKKLSVNKDDHWQIYKDYLRKNFDRSLTKAIVMPLIYGKTSAGFAEDLEAFFAKGNLFPKSDVRIRLANQVLKMLKEHTVLTKANCFMRTLRKIGKLLFDLDLFCIRGPYNISFVTYHKEEIERIRLYLKKGKRYQSQQISISKVVKDHNGNSEKAKTKTINAFVANYIHFLDGVVCHYIVKKLEKEGTLALGTIHDCFFIRPSQAEALKKLYKEGLVMAVILHQYNLLYWLHDIMECMQVKDISSVEMLSSIQHILKNLEDFQRKGNIDLENLEIPNSDKLIEILEFFKDQVTPLKNKAYWDDIIEYFKICKSEDAIKIMEEVLSDDTASLFPDNG